MEQPNSRRAQDRSSSGNESTGLQRVREAATEDRELQFTTLLHHVTVELLAQSYRKLNRDAAPGVDGVTWKEYGDGLEEKLKDLQDRIHRGAYRPQPSLRRWIPKADGRQRPLGIAALEDKIVQAAVAEVLNQIWEVDFLGFSYGFRPGRKQHDALDALSVGILRKKVNWVLDADIRGFFDNIDQEWMIQFVEHRIGDRRVVRLIQRWLKAGVLEEGKWAEVEAGTPQGAVISPILANLYLHYVLDLWVDAWREKVAYGDVIIVRYADDFVMGFQYREEAEKFLEQLRERMRKFKLELHPEKTRLIEFGRYAQINRKKRGEGRPETFNFLGFTHICGTNHKTGNFNVKRKTIGKKMAAKLGAIRQKLRQRMHDGVPATLKWLQSVVRGYFQYHAIPDNWKRMQAFRREVARAWWAQLRRRSQRRRWTWAKFWMRLGNLLPEVKIIHPYPLERFNVRYPR